MDKIGETKNTNEIEKDIEKLKITKTHIPYIEAYIKNIIGKKYDEETANLMIKVIKEKINSEGMEEGNMLMEAFVDKFLEEGERRGKKAGEKIGEKRGIAQGKKLGVSQGISQVAINMLKEKCDKNIIKKYTGLSDAKIKELEKTLQSA